MFSTFARNCDFVYVFPSNVWIIYESSVQCRVGNVEFKWDDIRKPKL